jgi:hypothetical protein
MGMISIPWPRPNVKSIRPPAIGVTLWDVSHISTGKTSEKAQGAQPSEKKNPNENAPMNAEYLNRFMEKVIVCSNRLFLSEGGSSGSFFRKDMRELMGSIISPMGLRMLMPKMTINKPAARSKKSA